MMQVIMIRMVAKSRIWRNNLASPLTHLKDNTRYGSWQRIQRIAIKMVPELSNLLYGNKSEEMELSPKKKRRTDDSVHKIDNCVH